MPLSIKTATSYPSTVAIGQLSLHTMEEKAVHCLSIGATRALFWEWNKISQQLKISANSRSY